MDITQITTTKLSINLMETYHRPVPATQSQLAQQLLRLLENNPGGMDAVNPVSDMKIKDLDFVDNYTRLRSLEDYAK